MVGDTIAALGQNTDGGASLTLIDPVTGVADPIETSFGDPVERDGYLVGPDNGRDGSWVIDADNRDARYFDLLRLVSVEPGSNAVWGSRDGGLVRVDVATDEASTFAVPSAGVDFHEGFVYVSDGRGIQQLDPTTGSASFVARFSGVRPSYPAHQHRLGPHQEVQLLSDNWQ